MIEEVEILEGDPIKPKPKFNPNAAFEAVKEVPIPKTKKPAFNPNTNYETVVEEKNQPQQPTQPQVFQVQISQPTRYQKDHHWAESELSHFGTEIQEGSGVPKIRDFSFTKTHDPLAVTKLGGKAREAQAKLHSELQGNDKEYEKKLREYKRDSYTIESLREDYKNNGWVLPPQDEQRILQKEKQKRYDEPISSTDISDIKTGTFLNEAGARKFIKDLKRPEVLENSYLVDKFNELVNDPNGNNRVEKINKVAKQIKKGEVIYDPEKQIAIKPLGVIGGILEGTMNKWKLEEKHDFLKNTENDSAIIKELEDERNNPDRDEPIKVPKGKAQEFLMMAAEMPWSPMIAGAVGSLAGPQAGMAAGTAIGAYENRKIQFTTTFQQVYNELRDQDVPENEALQEARKQAEDAQEIGTIVGAAQGFIGAKIGATPLKGANFSAGYQQAIGNLLKQNGSELGKVLLEGAAQGGIGALGEVAKNKLAQIAGINRDIDAGTADQFWTNVMMAAGIGVAIKGGRGLSKIDYKKVLHGLKSVPEERLNSVLQEKVNAGEVTQEAADGALQQINEYKGLDQLIPDNVTEEARFKIQDKIQKRNQLEQQIESTDKAYHPAIKEKIKAIDEEIIALSKETEKPPKAESGLTKSTEKEAIETAEEFLAEGILPDTYKPMIEADPIGFWKMISQQAHNRDEQWRPLSEPIEEAAVREQFGDTVVEYAKDLFPAPEIPASTDKVSVIMPGEIKQPETITIAPREQPNAVPSTDKVSVIMPQNKEIEIAGSRDDAAEVVNVLSMLKDSKVLSNEEKKILFRQYQRGVMNEKEISKYTHIDIDEISNGEGNKWANVLMDKMKGKKVSAEDIDFEELPQGNSEGVRSSEQGNEVTGTQEGQPEVQQEGAIEGQKEISGPREVGITHRQMDAIAEEFGLPTYEKSPERVKEWDEQAAKRLENPEELPKLFGKLRNGELPDAVETRMMLQYMGDLMAKIDSNPTDEALITQLKRTKDLFNVAGRLQGKGLAARKGTIVPEERLGDFLLRDMEANKAPLTEDQKAQTIKEYEEIKTAKDALDEKVAKLETENAKLKAEKKIATESKATKKDVKKDFGGERKQIITDIKEKLRKARGETSVVAVPYAKELIAIAPDVIKLAKSYVEQGITELPALVRHIKDVLKDDIPAITDKDVHNIIAGEYAEKKPSRNQLAQQLFDLKREAKLINELEALQSGQVPTNPQKQKIRNQKIEKLREQIKELRDEMGLNEKTDDQKLSALKARYKKQISELEKKIAAGDFGPDEKPEPLKLDKEGQDLKNKLNELKRERELRLAKEEYENRTKLQKAKDLAIETLNTPRTIMASVDMSAPLRQGLVATVSHPSKAAKAFPEMVKQAFSEKRFENWLTDLKESPEYPTMEKSGLYVADPDNLNLAAKEEQFMGSLVDRIPLIKNTIGKLVKGSERAYVAYLNKMRVDIFKQGMELFESQGRTVENSPELYEGLANYINNATGRGGLGPLNKAAPILNTAFFSPRLIASRINLLNPVYYTKLPKEVRMMALKDMAKVVAFGTTILGLASAAGAEVEKDPRSSDFGKIKVGNTRWDVWGGFQQYIRLAAQEITGETKSTTSGKIRELRGDKFPYKSRLDQMANFFRGKLAPVPGTAIDLLAGRNVVGEEFDASNKAYELFVPMIAQDIKEAWKDQGFVSLFTVGVPSSLGVGASTYGEKKSGSRESGSSKGVKKGLNKQIKKDLKK